MNLGLFIERDLQKNMASIINTHVDGIDTKSAVSS